MRKALIIGIDVYKNFGKLDGCVADAKRMRDVLECHEDKTRNYDCRLFTSSRKNPIDARFLRQKWRELFDDFEGEILFYYSGHGAQTDTGGQFALQDGDDTIPGLAMSDLLLLANSSTAREIVMILDCCYAGGFGDPAILMGNAFIRKGLTILAATSPKGLAKEKAKHGVFTDLVVSALRGGAADVRGDVSAASVYAYVDQALGAWDQRPVYKSYATRTSSLRRCRAQVPHDLLAELSQLFKKPDSVHHLSPSYEHTHKSQKPKNVELFNKFKLLRDARLLRTVEGEDLYYTALKSRSVILTPLGQFYWRLAKDQRL